MNRGPVSQDDDAPIRQPGTAPGAAAGDRLLAVALVPIELSVTIGPVVSVPGWHAAVTVGQAPPLIVRPDAKVRDHSGVVTACMQIMTVFRGYRGYRGYLTFGALDFRGVRRVVTGNPG